MTNKEKISIINVIFSTIYILLCITYYEFNQYDDITDSIVHIILYVFGFQAIFNIISTIVIINSKN